MYTSHGHAIPGTPLELPRPDVRMRCGGPGLCKVCSDETLIVRNKAEYTKELDDLTPMVFLPVETDNGGNPDIYLDTAKTLVVEAYNRAIVDIAGVELITEDEVYIVSFSKVLQNWKALLSTDRSDGRYYELTHDGDKQETYVDTYIRVKNETITDASR